MALERAYSDVPGTTSEEQTTNIPILPSLVEAGAGIHVVDLTVLEGQSEFWAKVDFLSKRGLDMVVSVFVLTVTAILFAGIWAAIRISSPGPAIFRHMRVGRNGEPFECLKFRTMVMDADAILDEMMAKDSDLQEEFERNFKLKRDPRVTSVGHFLRRTSLDELPQFWNVLRGDMSVVGPRPIVEEERLKYGSDLGLVLGVRPGITGLWQISGRNDLSYEQRVALDRRYALTRTLLLDLSIMTRTPVAALRPHNGAY
ncbi:MAG: sugar transferase [Acidimicrobiia bacterium]